MISMERTRSEIIFERFLTANGIPFKPIPVGPMKTPDYAVTIGGAYVIFEVKEIAPDPNWNDSAVHGGTVGELIRDKVRDRRAMKQIQSASKQGKPTVLLIFNAMDPMQMCGTENHDFEHAMYGEYTIWINIETREIVDRFHGHNKSFQQTKNTSFSALSRLKEGRGGSISVTLFENVHAKIPINYDALPAAFEVVRVERPTAVA